MSDGRGVLMIFEGELSPRSQRGLRFTGPGLTRDFSLGPGTRRRSVQLVHVTRV